MKPGISKELRKALAKDNACYVLITCSEPSKSGDMDVNMTYEGDPALAAYLLESSQDYIEGLEEFKEEEDLSITS